MKHTSVRCRGSADPGEPNGYLCGSRHGLSYDGVDSAGRIRLRCRCGAIEVPVLNVAYRTRRAYYQDHPLER